MTLARAYRIIGGFYGGTFLGHTYQGQRWTALIYLFGAIAWFSAAMFRTETERLRRLRGQ